MPDELGNSKDYEVGYGKPPKSGQFKKGNDPRRWKYGKPKDFDALRELAQQIAHEAATRADGSPVVIGGTKTVDQETGLAIIVGGHTATIAEMILRQWAQSGKPQLQQGFIEIAFGKVPTPIEIRDWREAAKQAGIENPDEVVNDFVKVISAKMGRDGDSGSNRDGGEAGESAEVDAAPIAESATG